MSITQGPKVQQKTKEQKLAAALAGGKSKKKKWSKGKLREKMNAKVLFDEDGWKRLQEEVPKVRQQSTSWSFFVLRGRKTLSPDPTPLSHT